MKERILLIDTSSILHAVKFSLGKQKLSHKNKPTFIIYGFLMKLQFLLKKTKATLIVFALDSQESKRREIYPEYKAKRIKKDQTEKELKFELMIYDQFAAVTDFILPTLGYRNIYRAEGYEADDIIARISKKYKKQAEVIIVSNDGDLFQLLHNKVCILNSQSNEYFTKKKFITKYGIAPKWWKKVKSIGGCSSDNVAGIPGVGEKTVIKYLRGQLPATYKTYKAIVSEDGKKIAERNKALVYLPFKETPKYNLMPNHVSKKGLIKIAKKYGLKSILNNIDEWARVLKAR